MITIVFVGLLIFAIVGVVITRGGGSMQGPSWSPGQYLGYSTTTIFVGVLGFLVYVAVTHLTPEWLFALGISVLAPCVVLFWVFLGLKLWAMFKVDTMEPMKKRVPSVQRRKRENE